MQRKLYTLFTAGAILPSIIFSQTNGAIKPEPAIDSSSEATIESPTSSTSKKSDIQIRVALENLDIKSYNYPTRSIKTDLEKMTGINFAVAYEFKLIDALSTSTIASFSYAKSSNENLEYSYKDMENYNYKLNQTINFNIYTDNSIVQPFIGFGIGYGTQKNSYTDKIYIANANEYKYEGKILEANIGVQLLLEKWVPFITYSKRKHNIEKYSRISSKRPNYFEDVKDESYTIQVINIGAGYRF